MERTIARFARLERPTAAPEVVVSERVLELLGTATGRVAVVVGPAGYGKTSHVAIWAAGQARPVAWGALEPGDDEPAALLDVLVRLLSEVTDLPLDELPADRGDPQRAHELAPALGHAVRRCRTPFVLVLDDVHAIVAPEALDLLDALASNVPEHSTVVLVGRTAPTAILARRRVDAGIVEISTSELRLDSNGARRLLVGLGADLDLDAAGLAELVDATEGWPVGVRLAALAMADADPADASRPWVDRAVSDYVREEWLTGLAADDLAFLTQVSGFDRLSGAVCDGVLGRADSGEVLERLLATHRIVLPLDRQGRSYRLHRVLRDVLDAQFERTNRDGRRDIDRRASEWFEREGDIDLAVRHAVAADDLDRAARLVAAHATSYQTHGWPGTVAEWIRALPTARIRASASLCLTAAMSAFAHGDPDGSTTWLRFAEGALSGTDADRTLELEIATFRAVLDGGSIAAALEDAAAASRDLPVGPARATAYLVHGALRFETHDDEVAIELLGRAAAEAHLVEAVTIEAISRSFLAVVHGAANDWPRAFDSARAARRSITEHGLDEMPTLALVTAMGALTEAMDGDPVRARADVVLTRRHLLRLRHVAGWVTVPALLAIGRACLLLGDRACARAALDDAEGHLHRRPEAVRLHAELTELATQVRSARDTLPVGPSALTAAELRVLHYLPTNLTHAEIAQRLFVSRNTAKSHAAALYRKLGATSRGEAVEIARAAGLLPSTEGSLVGS